MAARHSSNFSMILLRTCRLHSLKFYLYMGHTVRVMNQNNAIKNLMEKLIMISLFVRFLWTLIWSFRQWNAVRIQLSILEREVYHGITLWFSIMFESVLSLMYIIWGKRQCISTTSTHLIITRTPLVLYSSLKLYCTVTRGSFQT